MTHTSGQTLSSWPHAADPLLTVPLTQDLTADVCIVGSGLAGLTTAYLLLREGRSVVVLDKGPVGGGNTGRTTAQLSSAFDDRYSELIRIHGEAKARLVAHSHSAATDVIGAIAREEGIDCDYERVSGYLFTADKGAKKLLDEELEAAHRAGLTGVAYLARPPLAGFGALPCLHFPDQGQFHPLKYLHGLARVIQARGGRIYTDTPVDGVRDGQPAQVRTRSGLSVTAGAVVVATNSPINDRVALHTKQAPYLSYVIAAEVPRGSVPRALY